MAERAGERIGVGGLAGSFSVACSSVVALGGEGAMTVGGALAGELVISSKIVVALQKYTGLISIVRSKREVKRHKEEKILTRHLFENRWVCPR